MRSITFRQALAAAVVLGLGAGACVRTQSASYRWGGETRLGSYLVDMGSLKRAGARVDFDVMFIPRIQPQKPELAKVYTRSGQWIDCTSGMQAQTYAQAYVMAGFAVGGRDGPDATATAIKPDTSWSSVRDLTCEGRSELDATPLAGTDAQVALKARAFMNAHPVEDAVGPA